MNAQSRRNRRTQGPIITLVSAAIVAVVGLGISGANAEGVPTPSETTVLADTEPAAPIVDAPVVVPPTTPTGTTVPAAP